MTLYLIQFKFQRMVFIFWLTTRMQDPLHTEGLLWLRPHMLTPLGVILTGHLRRRVLYVGEGICDSPMRTSLFSCAVGFGVALQQVGIIFTLKIIKLLSSGKRMWTSSDLWWCFNVHELGQWDPSVSYHFPLSYIGGYHASKIFLYFFLMRICF